jgi:DNA-binding beta-propeller fold protein YncE
MARRPRANRWRLPALALLVAAACSCPGVRLDAAIAENATAQPEAPGDLAAIENKIEPLAMLFEDYSGQAMRFPSRVCCDPAQSEIYVTDTGNTRILVYTNDFFPLLSIGPTEGIDGPMAVAVEASGRVFVAQGPSASNKRGRITILNPALMFEKDIFFSGFPEADKFVPTALVLGRGGRLYVAGTDYPALVVLDPEGVFSHLISPLDALGDERERPTAVCDVDIDAEGRLYLVSEEMGRIYVYDADEKLLFKFGMKGGGSGKLSRPHGVAVDSENGRIYVIDYMRHTANAYGMDGEFLFEFGGMGWREGWFQYPADIAVDPYGRVLVSDTFNHRVQVLHLE